MFGPGAGLPALWPVVVFPNGHISNFLFYTQGPEMPSASGSFPLPGRTGSWERAQESTGREQRPEDRIHTIIWVLKAFK